MDDIQDVSAGTVGRKVNV